MPTLLRPHYQHSLGVTESISHTHPFSRIPEGVTESVSSHTPGKAYGILILVIITGVISFVIITTAGLLFHVLPASFPYRLCVEAAGATVSRMSLSA
jgi:hypothetical protein